MKRFPFAAAALVLIGLAAAPTHATIIINESDFTGGFEESDPTSATDLAIPTTDTVVINSDPDNFSEGNIFDFSLPFDAATVEFSVIGFLNDGFVGISSGLNSGTYDILNASVFDGDTLLVSHLPAGDYTVDINDGGLYVFTLTITPVPEPASLTLLALGTTALLTRRRRA
ncbi:MAG: PEP-CTERM sorting domain-containing protein [Planctomycetota bacterium]